MLIVVTSLSLVACSREAQPVTLWHGHRLRSVEVQRRIAAACEATWAGHDAYESWDAIARWALQVCGGYAREEELYALIACHPRTKLDVDWRRQVQVALGAYPTSPDPGTDPRCLLVRVAEAGGAAPAPDLDDADGATWQASRQPGTALR